MKKMLTFLSGTFIALLIAISLQAQNPHLNGMPKVTQVGDYYLVEFQAAGLGGGNAFHFEASMNITQQQYCTSNGKSRQRNAAGNPCTAAGTGSSDYGSAKNGNLKGSIMVPIDLCQEPVDCPGKQQAMIISTWSDLVITVTMPDASVVTLYPF